MKRTTLCAALLLAASPFSPLSAQGVTLAPFAASNAGLSGAPPLAGLSATLWSGPIGIRTGGAMDAGATPLAPLFSEPGSEEVRAWAADVDLLLSGGRLGVRIAGIEPGVLVGLGVHGQRDPLTGEASTIPVWSYGVTAGLPVTNWLELAGEGRYRMPHSDDELPAGVAGGLELRVGLALNFGRRRRSSPSAAPSRPRATGALPRTIHLGRGGPAGTGDGEWRSSSAAERASRTIATGDGFVGVPYVWGGESPSQGFDCSGFVQYVYRLNGVRLPRVSRDQARAGSPLPPSLSSVQPGDLLFFAGSDGVVDHVAIYVGDGTILHASGSRGAVGYDRLDSRRGRWYRENLVGARRVIR